jgi:hypothetical protein
MQIKQAVATQWRWREYSGTHMIWGAGSFLSLQCLMIVLMEVQSNSLLVGPPRAQTQQVIKIWIIPPDQDPKSAAVLTDGKRHGNEKGEVPHTDYGPTASYIMRNQMSYSFPLLPFPHYLKSSVQWHLGDRGWWDLESSLSGEDEDNCALMRDGYTAVCWSNCCKAIVWKLKFEEKWGWGY